MKESIKVAIAGATGYVGIELTKILSKHPKVKIKYLCAQKFIGKEINKINKSINSKKLPKISNLKKIDWSNVDVIFTALPNGEAQRIAKIKPTNIKLIDLSADFRLKDYVLYKKWYGTDHKSKNLISKSLYSITEFSKKDLTKYNIIACPGCYPTSIQIPLVPLLVNKKIKINNIIIDSKSGYSGGGKNVEKKFPLTNIYNSVSAYGLSGHRHLSEIEQELSKVAKKKLKVFFTPHLIPMFRGILSTIYLDTNKKNDAKNIYNFLKKIHKNNYFIKFGKFNSNISTSDVINTNFCKITVCKSRDANKIIIVSVIDNLIKGASGQAIQNMNVSFNFNETLGLI